MEIRRGNNSIIKKKKINLSDLEQYDDQKIKLAVCLLRQEIENSFINHFDYIPYALHENDNFLKSIQNSGCISECKSLKKKLRQIGITTYFISCKANGFSNLAGDDLVKEAHVFLIYPAFKNGKVFFTIFDPGFRMFNIIQFYDEHHSAIVPYILDGEVKVIFNNEEKYPYQLIVNRRINYKHQIVPANIEWSFNPYYQTLNINDFNQQLYQAMFSLKLMNFPNDLTKYLCVRAKVIDQVIEVYTLKKNEIFSFQEMKNLPKEQFKQIFSLYFKEANLSDAQLKCFFKSLSLLVNNVDVYIDEVINSKVVEAYKLGNMLNR